MADFVLDHHLTGERARLAMMSRLLDPMHRRHLDELGIGPPGPRSGISPPASPLTAASS